MKTKSRRNFLALLAAVMLLSGAVALHAEQTHRWRQSTHEEFLKGTASGIAVRSDGRLEAAPRFLLLADADTSYLLALRLDAQGAVYAAGGSPAKVFRLDSGSNKPVKVFESSELSAQALALDGQGGFFVGTSPDGKVYHVTAQGQKTVFFDPGAKYIWDLALGADGTLYVATGDKGLLYAVSPEGQGQRFYSSDEAHIRVLAFDGKGNLLAGTEPNGRVLRFSLAAVKAGQEHSAFVLLETSKHEVTALAAAGDGSVYAAAIGEKQRPGIIAAPIAGQSFVFSTGLAGVAAGGAAPAAPAPGGVQLAPQIRPLFSPAPAPLASAIYRIAPDGAPEEIWSSREEGVYSLGLDGAGRVLAGTGNGGALLAIDGHKLFAQLAKSGSAQVTGMARGADGRVILCTANPGKLFSAGPELEAEGSYESRSFDAKIFSRWGRLEWWSTISSADSGGKGAHARLAFFVRSGNTEDPGREWSAWAGPYTKPGETVQAPAARFVQWKAVLRHAKAGEEIDWVSLAYLPRNVAPEVDGIAVQEPGVRVQGPFGITGGGAPAMVTLKSPAQKGAAGLPGLQALITPPKMEAMPQGTAQKGFRSVLWTAHDDNEDELRYAVYYRGEGEHDWKLLKDGLEQKFYSWDATAFPDGAYYLKITATDAPSNPPAGALTAERESERFEVDNTPPVVEGLRAAQGTKKGGGMDAQCVARDAGSGIERAEYSLDGGEWTMLAPVGELSDANEERYEWSLSGLAPGEHTLAVRAADRQENAGSAKIVFTVAGAKH